MKIMHNEGKFITYRKRNIMIKSILHDSIRIWYIGVACVSSHCNCMSDTHDFTLVEHCHWIERYGVLALHCLDSQDKCKSRFEIE
jgi:hypothetical protein